MSSAYVQTSYILLTGRAARPSGRSEYMGVKKERRHTSGSFDRHSNAGQCCNLMAAQRAMRKLQKVGEKKLRNLSRL